MEAALSLTIATTTQNIYQKMERGAITRINVTREKTRAAKYSESLTLLKVHEALEVKGGFKKRQFRRLLFLPIMF